MINRYTNRRDNKERFAKCKYDRESLKVQSNLVLTPAQMYGMALQGKPISSFQLPNENFDDGVPLEANEIHVPAYERRGVDVNDLYQRQKDLEEKFKGFRNKRSSKVVKEKTE